MPLGRNKFALLDFRRFYSAQLLRAVQFYGREPRSADLALRRARRYFARLVGDRSTIRDKSSFYDTSSKTSQCPPRRVHHDNEIVSYFTHSLCNSNATHRQIKSGSIKFYYFKIVYYTEYFFLNMKPNLQNLKKKKKHKI